MKPRMSVETNMTKLILFIVLKVLFVLLSDIHRATIQYYLQHNCALRNGSMEQRISNCSYVAVVLTAICQEI